MPAVKEKNSLKKFLSSSTPYLLLAGFFYAAGFVSALREAGWDAISWSRFAVLFPTVLLVVGFLNRRRRSRRLAFFLGVAGAAASVAILWALGAHLDHPADVPWGVFGRAGGLYLGLTFAGYFQFRADR
ncbi:MAG TPA: hypothetical protein P5079_06625 [Elusimicrobiota bacterium]|nr:hypothetical protein [Elusimicrobiota bacterium]